MLKAYTSDIFVVASEWDTQVGKQLRELSKNEGFADIKSRIFSTNIGLRPAEPCTLSVAATQQLLTEILLYLMDRVQRAGFEEVVGGKYVGRGFRGEGG